MGANVSVTIVSPHGGETRMALNPTQVERLVDILDGHRDMRDHFGAWFVKNLMPHADERPKEG